MISPSNGSHEVGVFWTICSSVGTLKGTILVKERLQVEERWITGIRAKDSKKLHDKISSHNSSKIHKLYEAQMTLVSEQYIQNAMLCWSEIWQKYASFSTRSC